LTRGHLINFFYFKKYIFSKKKKKKKKPGGQGVAQPSPWSQGMVETTPMEPRGGRNHPQWWFLFLSNQSPYGPNFFILTGHFPVPKIGRPVKLFPIQLLHLQREKQNRS
jgi:hypothetical protein